jgi:hypothetical protein
MSTYFMPVTGQDGYFMKSACCCGVVRFDVRSCSSKLFSKRGVAVSRTFLGSRDDEGEKKLGRNRHLRRIIVSKFLCRYILIAVSVEKSFFAFL